jgi:hypothetical protein
MAKKKRGPTYKRRNAAPRAAARPEDPSMRRLGYTAAGAAGTALIGTFLAHEGWAPKTIAGALAAVGAGLAWKGDGETVRSVGAGAMSAAGSQLALMMIDDGGRKKETPPPKKPANAEGMPAGALEAALERARMRLALTDEEAAHEAT